MKVAIVGGGFAGLSLAYYLLKQGVKVHLIDENQGASRVAVGLMHPYAGEKAKRAYLATEALELSLGLINEIAFFAKGPILLSKGLLRCAITDSMRENLTAAIERYGDVVYLKKDLFRITSGYLVDAQLYLETLLSVCKENSLFSMDHKKVDSLDELKAFDRVCLACGYGIRQFLDNTRFLRFLKGQVLLFKGEGMGELAYIAKGYLASKGEVLVLGATYEKEFQDELPDLSKAEEILLPRLAEYYPFVKGYEYVNCLSGVRVSHSNYSHPLIGKLEERLWVVTALGSKGLLYHGLLAKQLSIAICQDDLLLIDEKLRL